MSWTRSLSLALTAILLGTLSSGALAQDLAPEDLADKAARLGTVRVIVTLVGGFVPEPDLPTAAHVQRQRQTFAASRAALGSALTGTTFRIVRAPSTLPVVTLEVDAQGVRILRALPGVVADIVEDTWLRRRLSESVPLIGAPGTWALGYDGSGTIIAIVDDGVESPHPFLAGKVVREACFSSNIPQRGVSSLCPGGVEFSEAPGSAEPCNLDCDHGTHVAGIAAGGDGSPGSGVAKGAALWPIQVFSRIDNIQLCFPDVSCTAAAVSDVIEALSYLYTRRTSVPGMVLAAANLSLGGNPTGTSTCNTFPMKPAIDQLRAAGIASVIAAGNDGFTNAVSAPACISTAVSVGATGDTADTAGSVSIFSNLASFVSVLAPGEDIVSSVPPTGFASFDGTSMATPHVAGAFAILRQFAPQATVTQILSALRAGGVPVTDTRPLFCFSTSTCPVATVPRIRIVEALNLLRPDLVVSALTAPTLVGAGQTVAVAYTVKNQSGIGAAGHFDVGIYLSTDNVIDPSTDLLLATRPVTGLAPNASRSDKTSVTLPPATVAGAYFIIARADEANTIAETDEENNARSTATPVIVGPDLVVSAVTAPAKAQPGQPISLSGTVQNVGAGLVAGQTSTLAYYLSSDTELDGSDTLLGTRTVPGLGAGATSSGATAVPFPAVPIGVYFVIARADDGGVLTEAREDNNTRATVKTILVGPDIVVTVAKGPAGGAPGLPVTISNTVVNNGSVAVGFTVGFYLSSDEAFDGGDVLLGSRTVTGLGAGAGSAASTKLTIPASTAPGVYRVLVRADDGEVLGEANESNNVKATGPINVALPDLRVSAISMPLLVVAGRSVSISNTVRNDAPAPGGAAAFAVGLYLSSDDTIDPGSDVPLASRAVSGLAPGASSAATTTATLPNTPGDFFVGAVADPTNAVSEGDESNNTLHTAAVAIVPEMRRNAAGTVNATVEITLSDCRNPLNNDAFVAPTILKITTQPAAGWSGTAKFTSPAFGAGITTTFAGTVQTSGAIGGTFTFVVTNGAGGRGTFSGTATSSAGGDPGTLNAALAGAFTTGETCAVSGTLSQP
jgi:subtilisin family serine protease